MMRNDHTKSPQIVLLVSAFLVSVLLGIILLACPASASSGAKDKLIMATNAEFPPYEYYDGSEIVGIDVEIAQAIAEELDMELQIEDMAFDAIITAVTSGKADFGAAGLTVTEDRLKSVDFSDTYTKSAQVIIVKEDSPIATPEDLVGKKIGVQLGTTGDIYSADIEDAKIERYNKGFEAVQSLLSDKIDAVIIDQEPAAVFVSQDPGLKLTDEEFTEEEYALAIAKDNKELLEKVNTALAGLKKSGRLDEIKASYINDGAEEENQEEKEEPEKIGGKLIMATNAEFPPYEYYEGSEIVGIDAEIAQAIADELGMELQIEDMAFDAIITAVTSGKADFGAAGMTVTEDRLKSVDFSDTYTKSAQVIIVKEDSPIATPEDLVGKKIGVQLGTTGDIYSADIEDAKIERYNKGFEAVQSLLSDKIDAVIIDQEPATVFVSQNKGLKLTDEEFTEEEYALAIAKDNKELLEKVNTALAELKKSGRLDEIKASYIGTDDGGEEAPDSPGGKLIMATNAEFPPYEYYEGSEIVGIDVEIAQAVAEEMGMELQIEDMAFDSIITAVTSGKADFGAAGMTVTEDRLKSVDFSDPYTTSAQVIIVKEDSPIATPEDLVGKKIGVQLGTTGDIYAEDIEDATIERYNKGFEAIQSLLSDKIDAVVIDQEPAGVFVSQNKGLKLTDEEFTTEEYALAIAKGNEELLEKVNAALADLKESGRLDEIKAGYINSGEEETEEGSYGLKEAIYDNLVSEGRWKYIVNGLVVTLEITLLAVILGIIIGFVVAIIRSTYEKTRKLKFLNLLCQIYLTVIRGTPVLVQLLIIYYIIFASFTNKIVVASLAFGINSGAYVAEIIRGGILSIDNGQFEAGRSLGFNYLQTMVYIILPQALKNVLPALANEFVVLLKETSVCGYIALQDLTKGGDIIRSQTYNAYIPLLTVAVIYLALVMIFTYFVKLLERRLRSSERS